MGRKHQRRTPPSAPAPPSRPRYFLLLIAAVLAAVAMATAVWLWRGSPAGAWPEFVVSRDQNVLLITIDTLRADALGFAGGRAATPNLDALAARGVRFSFAHAHAVVTLPSHASILTGRHPHEHGVRENAGYRLDDSAVTLAELAGSAGMASGAFVGAFPLDHQFGLDQGFDVYDEVGSGGTGASEFALAERRAEEVVAAAREWIGAQPGPWFAWVHVFDPHAPYAAPDPYRQQYASDAYAGEVAYTDAALGPLLDDAREAERPTLVIVTSDHGEGLGDHGELTHGVFAYESTLRVPLVMAQVGAGVNGAHGGAVSDASVRHVDVLPTIAALLQLDAPEGLPGRTIVEASGDRPVYFEAMYGMLARGWAPLTGTIDGRMKYIDLPIPELYDLAADSGERQNLMDTRAGEAQRLASVLAGFEPRLPGAQEEVAPEVREKLQALGYVGGTAARQESYGPADDPKRLVEVDRLLFQGTELFQAGRAGEAVEAYRRAIELRPQMSVSYRSLAFVLWQTGRSEAAIDVLRQALERAGPSPELHARLGTFLAESGRAAEAVPLLEASARAYPDNIEVLNALGIACAQAGRPDESLRTFGRILEQDPRNALALENIGTVHLQRDDMAAAQDAFTRAVAVAPRSTRAHAGLGVVAARRGDSPAAIAHWRRAVEIDPTNYDALFNLSTELINSGRVADARPYLEQFARTAPPAFYGRDIARVRQLLQQLP